MGGPRTYTLASPIYGGGGPQSGGGGRPLKTARKSKVIGNKYIKY